MIWIPCPDPRLLLSIVVAQQVEREECHNRKKKKDEVRSRNPFPISISSI
jgi:hypothetical protein